MTVAELKKAMRRDALERRAELIRAAPDASQRMAERFLAAIPLRASAVVSAYVAIGDEADPSPLVEALRARGHAIVLPRIVGKGQALALHLCAPSATLVPGAFGVFQPGPDWAEAVPDVLVVPLLAFDARGNRLGYGAGFYDRTLAALRASRRVLAVGYAFAGQEVPEVPHHDGDETLDWIVTERDARPFAPEGT